MLQVAIHDVQTLLVLVFLSS